MLFIWTCMQMDDDQHNEFGSEISEEDDVQEINDKDDVVEVDKNHEEDGLTCLSVWWMNKWKQKLMSEICEADKYIL